mmetsp:Transcript_57082/g.93883  ORF Transcript_57082/g.93883 Transcript_57082/m.93883 type:complete len:109 (-) Transcript_57082:334-660(-)
MVQHTAHPQKAQVNQQLLSNPAFHPIAQMSKGAKKGDLQEGLRLKMGRSAGGAASVTGHSYKGEGDGERHIAGRAAAGSRSECACIFHAFYVLNVGDGGPHQWGLLFC